MSLPLLSDDFFYTNRLAIERAGCRVQRFDAQQFLYKNDEAQSTEFHGGCSGRREFTTGSLTITTDKSRTVSGWA